MAISLFANPGQQLNLAVETLNPSGQRADGYLPPVVQNVYMPDLSQSTGFPAPTIKLETGLYIFPLVIPAGNMGIGTFLVTIVWPQPTTMIYQSELFIINTALPFGNTSVFPV